MFGQPMLAILTTLIVLLTPLTQSLAATADPSDVSGASSAEESATPPDVEVETPPSGTAPPELPERHEEETSVIDTDVGDTDVLDRDAPEDVASNVGLDAPALDATSQHVAAQTRGQSDPEGSHLGCSYADPDSGAFAPSLCWIDLSGFTTEYEIVSLVNDCDYVTEEGKEGWVCWVTVKYASVLGNQYGSWEGSARNETPQTHKPSAESHALTQLENNSIKHTGNREIFKVGDKFYGPVRDYPISFPLDAGGALWFHASVNAKDTGSGTTGLVMDPVSLPASPNAALGNADRLNQPYGFYDGVVGRPALLQAPTTGANTSTWVNLDNVRVENGDEGRVYGYSLVSSQAYAEGWPKSLVEELNWTTSGGGNFRWLPNDPEAWRDATSDAARKAAALSLEGLEPNICTSGQSAPFGPNSASTGAQKFHCWGSPPPDESANGAAMVQVSPNPQAESFDVEQRMNVRGRMGLAFALVTTGAELDVKVADRVLDSTGSPSTTDFTASVTAKNLTDPAGSEMTAVASTGAEALESGTVPLVVPLSQGDDMQFTFEEGEDPALASYTQEWTCKKGVNGTDRAGWETYGGPTDPKSEPPSPEWGTVPAGWRVSCEVTYTPTYLSLLKVVDQDDTDAQNTADQWTLIAQDDAASKPTLSKVEAVGEEPSPEPTRYPVAATGTDPYFLSEDGPNLAGGSNQEAEPEPWPHGYDWTDITCSALDADTGRWEELTPEVFNVTPEEIGKRSIVEEATLQVAKGDDIRCTYTNAACEPKLVATKESDPASGSTLVENDPVTYTVTLSNEEGTAPATIDHVDHLADVLDDATWVGNVEYADSPTGSRSEIPNGVVAELVGENTNNPRVLLTGEVPRAETRVVTFQVEVKPNEEDSVARQDSLNAAGAVSGYTLTNYLTPSSDDEGKPILPPSSCEDDDPTCTTHPILAWAVTKSEVPEDPSAGADTLQAGDELSYRLRVERVNPAAAGDIEGIVVSDDLTQVFRYARWKPDAPIYAPAKHRGIYFYDADGEPFPLIGNTEGERNRLPDRTPASGNESPTLDDIVAENAVVEPPVFTPNTAGLGDDPCPGPGSTESGNPTNPSCFMGAWRLETEEFTLPSGAAYADVWFSVGIGFEYGEDEHGQVDLSTIRWDDPTRTQEWGLENNWVDYWQPYTQAQAGQTFFNVASADATGATLGEETRSLGLPLTCSTEAMSESKDPFFQYNPAGQALYPQADGTSAAVYPRGQKGPDAGPLEPTNPAKDGESPRVTAACTARQVVDSEHFVIRKDLLHRDAGTPTRSINMVGQEFMLEMLVPTETGSEEHVSTDPVAIENVCRKPLGESERNYEYKIGETAGVCTGDGWEPLLCTDGDKPAAEADPDETCARFAPIASGALAGRYRGDNLPPGEYWLTETKAPTGVREASGTYDFDTNQWEGWDATEGRWTGGGVTNVTGAQLLAEPIHFQVQENGGLLQVFAGDSTQSVVPTCTLPASGEVGNVPTACVGPTGTTMLVTDVSAHALPFAGGFHRALLFFIGAALFAGVLGTGLWKRRPRHPRF